MATFRSWSLRRASKQSAAEIGEDNSPALNQKRCNRAKPEIEIARSSLCRDIGVALAAASWNRNIEYRNGEERVRV